MSLEKLKLSKRLHSNMNELGYITATEFQLKTVSRIIGGHSLIGIAPDGAGKTTAYILGVLSRLKYTDDEAPQVLILAPNEEKIQEIVDQFIRISKNKNLHIMGLKASGNIEDEINELVLGVDIVVATPSRARAVYLKLGLNLNRIRMFIVDDAEEIIKQGLQTNVRELANSCGDVQYITMSTVEHQKLHLMIDPFMPFAPVFEVEELGEEILNTHELMLYLVPNFNTKINLLNTLISDSEVFDKVVVLVYSNQTAEHVFERLHTKKGESFIYQNNVGEGATISDIGLFRHGQNSRILIVNIQDHLDIDLTGIPFIINMEIPEKPSDFLRHALKNSDEEAIHMNFATDLELADLKKIESRLGKKIPVMELPEDLVIYTHKPKAKEKIEDPTQGGAFHEKKASNKKDYNLSGGEKAKLNKKK